MLKYTVLSITKDLGFTKSVINPVVIESDSDVILFDAGYPNQLDAFKAAMKKSGYSLSDITMIVVSHHDHDHIGSLKSLVDENPGITVAASEIEANYISGEQKSVRLIQAEEYNKKLDGKEKVFGAQFVQYLKTIEPCNVSKTVKENEYICEGVKVIHTPGHTPGHISLLLERESVFLAGDALAVENGKLVIANPQFTLDMEETRRSLEKIRNLKIKTLICYHGNVFSGNIKNGIDEILKNK
jgi:glyoxylase-like metal-dependent hydrolase (beta-lactamase superfamily II)